MIVIGLTGGIGSGKSTAGKFFRRLRYKVYEADEMARALLEKAKVKAEIVRFLGQDVLETSGKLSRKKIGKLVFQNKNKLRGLEKILHPAVIKQIRGEINRAKKREKNAAGVVFIIPLLFEKKLESLFDEVLTISCPREIRLERASRRLGIAKHEIEKRMRFQLDDKSREKKSDKVIRNNGSLIKMRKEIKKISEEISKA